VAAGLLSVGLAGVMAAVNGVPVPTIHDEFGYLLGADTFARGRLVNPTPAGWEHFESFHILMQPAYVPKFPPAPALFLALGQTVVGLPLAGVWLANALIGALMFWALRVWLPGRWALLGALLAAVHPLVLRWGQCYWGGSVAALGGVIVLGACGRIRRRDLPRAADAVMLGAGLLLLANSRPFEGLVLGLVTAIALLVWLVKRARPVGIGRLVTTFVLPVLIVLGIGAVWMGWYNFRATGRVTQFPYLLHEATYSEAPLFVWQNPNPPPPYRHEVLRHFASGWAMDLYRQQQSWSGWWTAGVNKLQVMSSGYTWHYLLLLPAVLALARAGRTRGVLYAAVTIALTLAPLLGLTYPLLPHYAAPFLPLALLLQLQGLRLLHRRPATRGLAALLVLACIVTAMKYVSLEAPFGKGYPARPDLRARAKLSRQLTELGGHHLVFVRYAPDHDPHSEWVYNGADPATAPIVWARDLGTDRNAELIRLYPGRQVWLLEPDRPPVRLQPYPGD
jgi:hypothetical protein